MSQLPEPKPLREVSGVDRRTFEAEIRPACQPVVLRGIGADWPAVQAAKESVEKGVDYILSFAIPDAVPALVGAPEIEGRFFYKPDFSGMNFDRATVALRVFFDRLLRDREVERPYSLAVQSLVIPEGLPGFVRDNHVDLIEPAVEPRIWIGNRIHVAPHFDLMENVGLVVLGRRRFTLFPPEQLPNLYVGPIEVTPAGTPVSMVDPHNPDLDRFPRYAEAAKHAQSAVLEPGDGIYIPFHWWHGVDSLDGVNAFVNYWWNPAPPGLGKSYDALMHALYAFRGMPEDQRRVWQMVFENFVFETNGNPVGHLPERAQGVLGHVTPEKRARMHATLKQIFSGP